MKEKRYIILFIILIMVGVFAYMLLPNFQTQEFDQNVVENIMDGVTTTSVSENSDSNNTNNQEENTVIESPIESEPEIKKLLNLNQTLVIKDNITSYLLIGSDKRSDESEDGYIEGQRADVIILGFFNETINKNALISIPRDTLVTNLCTGEVERINASFKQNNCGNGAENIVAAVNNLTGIKIEHIASFNFEGFEKIIDSFEGVEICVEETQREGYSFELQKGCQVVNGSTALNWVVSRNTEILVGEKKLDENGEDESEWIKMSGVSDLSRNERQQYVILQLLKRINDFSSLSDLNNFINALEDSFIVDENLTLNTAITTLWNFRGTDFDSINKLSLPTSPYELQDGRQVLIISKNFSKYAEEV